MKLTKKLFISVLLVGVMIPQALSDTITAELIFTKRPPFSGVLYVSDDKNNLSTITVDQKDTQFTKKLQVSALGQNITFNNSDEVDHNIFANNTKINAVFDVGLMTPGSTANIELNWKQNSLARIGCKIHPKMRAYIANITSNYYQVLPFEKKVKIYQVTINDVPSNLTSLNLLMPGYKIMQFQLQSGESKELAVSKKGKQRGTLKLSRK